VGKRATNAAVRGELGRYPLLINLISQSFKYWMRTCTLPVDNIVYKSYLESLVTTLDMDKKSWSACIYSLLHKYKLDNLWESQGNILGTEYSSIFIKTMQSDYEIKWQAHIRKDSLPNTPNKLDTYSKFKINFEMENYVLNSPLSARRNFTKLRISAHRLAIETGRYSKPITPRQNRLCTLCNYDKVEDEYHMLMDCTAYKDERIFFQKSVNQFSNIDYENTEHLFNLFMSYYSGDIEFSQAICKFVNACSKKRSEILSSSL